MLVSGLRFEEAINAYNLIIDGASEYFNRELSALEYFRFKEIFLRRRKKTYISLIPADLIEEIRMKGEKLNANIIRKRLQRRRIPLRFGNLREYWATLMTRYLTPAEIDFL